MISPTAIENFKTSLRGELLRPDDPGYDDARKILHLQRDNQRPPKYVGQGSDRNRMVTNVNPTIAYRLPRGPSFSLRRL